jgi:hypothetical protein
MTHYVALDVTLRSVTICIVDSNGDIKLGRPVNSEVEDIVQILRSFDGVIDIISRINGRIDHQRWLAMLEGEVKWNPYHVFSLLQGVPAPILITTDW